MHRSSGREIKKPAASSHQLLAFYKCTRLIIYAIIVEHYENTSNKHQTYLFLFYLLSLVHRTGTRFIHFLELYTSHCHEQRTRHICYTLMEYRRC